MGARWWLALVAGSLQALLLFLAQDQELGRAPTAIVKARSSVVAAVTGIFWGGLAMGIGWDVAGVPVGSDVPVALGAMTGFLLGLFLNSFMWSAVDGVLNG